MDVLTIEVGSTITKANAFHLLPEGRFKAFAQGFAPTSVASGDVGLGVEQSITALKSSLTEVERSAIDQAEIHLNSSAAGGLRMTVHGLTMSMTARAAREAALGAGAIIKFVTAGALEDYDLREIFQIKPNIILLAGGVDYGEKRIILGNAQKLAALGLHIPVIYAGNIAIRSQVAEIFSAAGQQVLFADNVFPEVDQLNIEPVRALIHEVFNRHIIHAPGMGRLSELTSNPILPTPGAVLKGAELFAEAIDDCLVLDVGGATTDVHSVTDGSPEWTSLMTEPEPHAKRTVEGDLGVYVNAANIAAMAKDPVWTERMSDLEAMPKSDASMCLTHWLCQRAVETAIQRHAGQIISLYTPTGKKNIVKGKDLTAVKYVIGTGGALTRIPGGREIMRGICTGASKYLFPSKEARILIDENYRFSALGTLAHHYAQEVKASFRHWLESDLGIALSAVKSK